jgi:hypothetical protein
VGKKERGKKWLGERGESRGEKGEERGRKERDNRREKTNK